MDYNRGPVAGYTPAGGGGGTYFDFSSGLAGSVPISSDLLNTPSLAPSGPASMNVPSIGNLGAGAGGAGAGMSTLGNANAAISGLQTLGALWMANKQMKLAKKQFKFNKDITNINLNNQMQSYNTALADRARGRGVMEGQTSDQVSQYINANSLSRSQGKGNGYSLGDVNAAALSNYNSYLGRGTSGASAASGSSASASAPAVAKDDKTAG
jgi:hypothetical protein